MTPLLAEITFFGSFAETYEGHGTNLAVVAGLLGYGTDHPRIPLSLQDAKAAGMDVRFLTAHSPLYHPNTAKLLLQADGTEDLTLIGSSIGGGNVEIVNVGGFDVKFTGAYPTLVINHEDRPGMVADITDLLRDQQINIGGMDVDRKGRQAEAMTVLEIDSPPSEKLIAAIESIKGIRALKIVDLTGAGSS
jgi:L-serine dehydratase